MTGFPPLVSRLLPSLGRENTNEVVAAARAIGAALKTGGLDWHDLAKACASKIPVGEGVPSPSRSPSASFGDLARACRDLDGGHLTPRERGFVREMCAKGFAYRPSSRQSDWLTAIFDRLQVRAAA